MLACWVAESECEARRGAMFAELKQRGLSGVRYIVSDDHAGMVKTIGRHFQDGVWRLPGAFRAQRAEPVRRGAAKAPKVATLLEEHGEEILGVYALPEPHRNRMRTTNMLERQNQELKRRTRLVRIFPNAKSCLRLVSALLIETSQEWMELLYLRIAKDTATETHATAV